MIPIHKANIYLYYIVSYHKYDLPPYNDLNHRVTTATVQPPQHDRTAPYLHHHHHLPSSSLPIHQLSRVIYAGSSMCAQHIHKAIVYI